MWAIPLKRKYGQTITNDFSNFSTTSKRKPLKVESDLGLQWYNSIFQNLLKGKNFQHYSKFTDKGPSIAEKVLRSIRNLLKKPVFLAGNADWLSELPTVIKHYNYTIHHSIKISPVEASKTINETEVYSNLEDKRKIRKPKFKLGQLVRTNDIKRVFSRRDSINYSYKLYTITGVIHDTIPSYRLNYLHERYKESLLLPTKLSFEQNNQVMKELKIFQQYKT